MEFKSINDEILKNILNENKKLQSKIDEFYKYFESKQMKDAREVEDVSDWLKEITAGFNILNKYFDKFPNTKAKKYEYFSDKIEKLYDDQDISSETLKIFLPLMFYYQFIVNLRNA